MIVRIQGREGTRRLEVKSDDSLLTLLHQISLTFSLNQDQSFSLYRSPGFRDELTYDNVGLSLSDNHISHGDLLYMKENDSTRGNPDSHVSTVVVEDEIDRLLRKKDGKIKREKHPQLCRHGPNGKCLNCAPLEPFDHQYLSTRDPPIKHLSFHCYLRKLMSGADKGKFLSLEDLSLKIKSDCLDHAPWPEGVCTKCQPSAVTLARQPYRHIDNIMFEDKEIVDRFLQAWRISGVQRIGFLYGHYEEYDEVPLGIKAVVAAIYEPPQLCTKNSIEILEDPNSEAVKQLANDLGIVKLGWIFTDLESEGDGKVAYKRNIHTYLLTSEECIMAADFQNSNPSPFIQSNSGYFGSKFVTVCITGNELHQVDTTGYQVSNQCMALVRDECLVPTLDAPELGYIKVSTSDQYVPDVLYKCKGEYGTEITKIARPLPVEYLLVELTTTTPLKPHPSLPGGRGDPFPIENRDQIGQSQSFESFMHYLEQVKGSNFLCIASEFHFLYFLYTTDVFQVQKYLQDLCLAIRNQDRLAAENWRSQSYWREVENLILAASTDNLQSKFEDFSDPNSLPEISSGIWRCQYCTLDNPNHINTCTACGLPRN